MGFNQAYLTTHDKQKFYEHLGYTYCQPILSLGSGSNLLSEEMVRYNGDREICICSFLPLLTMLMLFHCDPGFYVGGILACVKRYSDSL